jgi:hypothetical protein
MRHRSGSHVSSVVFLLLFCLQACKWGSQPLSNAIKSETFTRSEERFGVVGGVNANSDDRAALTTVSLLSNGKILCTATLIDAKWALSAAHCFESPVPVARLEVGFGLSTQTSLKRKVTRVIVHEKYNPQTPLQEEDPLHDIALLAFEGDIPSPYKAAALIPAQFPLNTQTDFTLAGYGKNRSQAPLFGSGTGEGTLRQVNVKLAEILKDSFQLKFLSNEGKAVCSGDSGGPAYLLQNDTWMVVGVTSWGYARCEAGLSVLTDVRAFVSWIGVKKAQSPTGSPTIPAPTSPPNVTTTAAPPDAVISPISEIEESYRKVLPDAQATLAQLRTIGSNEGGEISEKNSGKYDRRTLLFWRNTASRYFCVQVRSDFSDFGRPMGQKSGAYIYFGPIRISQKPNFDAFGCRYQAGGAYWYLF